MGATATKIIQHSETKKEFGHFTNGNPGIASKVAALKVHHIKLYYGNTDKDIQAAKTASARGIRIIQASNSNNLLLPAAGNQGESVIVYSQD